MKPFENNTIDVVRDIIPFLVVHRHLNWDTTEKLVRLRLQEFATALDIVIQF